MNRTRKPKPRKPAWSKIRAGDRFRHPFLGVFTVSHWSDEEGAWIGQWSAGDACFRRSHYDRATYLGNVNDKPPKRPAKKRTRTTAIGAQAPNGDRPGGAGASEVESLRKFICGVDDDLKDTKRQLEELRALVMADNGTEAKADNGPVIPDGYEFCSRDEADRRELGGGFFHYHGMLRRKGERTWERGYWAGGEPGCEYRWLRKIPAVPSLPPEIASHWRVVDSFEKAWPMGKIGVEELRAGFCQGTVGVGLWTSKVGGIIWLAPKTEGTAG